MPARLIELLSPREPYAGRVLREKIAKRPDNQKPYAIPYTRIQFEIWIFQEPELDVRIGAAAGGLGRHVQHDAE